MKQLLSLLVAAMFAAVSFSAAAQAPAPSTDTPPAATEKKAPKKARKAKKAKKAKKADDAAATTAPETK